MMVPSHGAKLRDQRGFTLIELMVVVAVIAILAIVVVPTFFRESAKTKAISEVAPMFAEISVKQEQHKVEFGSYLDIAVTCPATTSSAGVASSGCAADAEWVALRVNPPESTLRCQYEIKAGIGAGTTVAGFTFTSPTGNWYYLLATCDMDNSSTVNARFFTSSVDSAIQRLNEGN